MKVSKQKMAMTASGAALFSVIALSAAASIENPGFESDWESWSDTDPSAISGVAYAGSKSAKLSGSGAKMEQQVSVSSNTNYRLSAYVDGAGTLGAVVSGSTHQVNTSSGAWKKLEMEFNSGSAQAITVFGAYNGAEGRFDSFALENLGGGSSSGGSSSSSSSGGGVCTGNNNLAIVSASDEGSNDGHGPANVIDGSLADESRWSSQGVKWITLDIGVLNTVKAVDIAWYKGDQRSSYFSIETSADNSNWATVLASGQSSGNSADFESYDLIDSTARYLRLTGSGNSANNWNSILEMDVIGCGDSGSGSSSGGSSSSSSSSSSGGSSSGGTLDPSLPPSSNFDLGDWYVSVPTDSNGDGKADSIYESELNSGYQNSSYFYTASDGGMVFRCPINGYKTSTNTSYTRTELREMLRRGDTSISTQGVNKNNWVFGSAPSSARTAAGGVDGVLRATLAVNHVTTTGDSSQVGRVIVGQIHANNDEPLRLYYRKLPGNSKGSIYIAHEPKGGSDTWYDMIGSRSSSAANPSDGIALNETFSYEIKVVGNTLTVTISRQGKADVTQVVNMSSSGYDTSDQYHYFKAGVYNQNNTGSGSDYVQATFYELENSHTGYAD
ncbi:polysaccharide lyase family 7 protein [Microbulbifer harenosus]|uniref:Cyclic nucleotide-binding protein n=1 Tax=Microbulbifer harenosus TaxID=2576840 RepID=A0ABY2UEG2_9GAMM|nr:polysaccharide lyase family 7 protein [Microbulbifer harenosus]TLM75648.1 cyclic nucleotide-binding protein [Microbulbifer harenosus]